MNLPQQIKDIIESYANSCSLRDLKKISAEISNKYEQESGNNKRLVLERKQVIAYAISRMPATFAAVSTSMEYFLSLINDDIETVLDVGSGSGTGILACKYLLPKLNYIDCIEREPEMITFANENFNTNQIAKFIQYDLINGFPINLQYDLVLCAYSLNELGNEERKKLLINIWNSTKKYILIVEPGTPKGYKEINEIRDYFLTNGGHVIAPCTHCNNCPIPENDWCNFSTRVARSKLHKILKGGDAPFEDEKFIYLAISKNKIQQEKSRILRHPIIQGSSIKLKLCNPDGSISERIILKSNKQDFKQAKKSSVGDLI